MTPGWLIVLAAALLPWSTKLPLVTSDPGRAYVTTPLVLWLAILLGALALWISQRDLWLGAFAGWGVLGFLLHPALRQFETVEAIVLGSAALCWVREVDQAWHPRLKALLIWSAGLQVGWLWMQSLGVDWTWAGWGPFTEAPRPHGTFGNAKYLAAYLAMIIPMTGVAGSLWLLTGLIGTLSVLGLLAAGLGWAWQCRRPWRWMLGLVAVMPGVLLLHHGGWNAVLASGQTRWEYWSVGLRDLHPHEWVLGAGPGMWMEHAATLPIGRVPALEGFPIWMHSDVLQVLYEGGLVAVLIAGAWLWTQQAMWRGPWRGSAAAVGLLSLAFMPFHLITTGVVALVVLGCATTKEETRC